MVKYCASCGWEMKEPAVQCVNSMYCVDCTREDGSLKSFDEVLDLIASDIVRSQGIDRIEAERMAKEIMLRLPAWEEYRDRD